MVVDASGQYKQEKLHTHAASASVVVVDSSDCGNDKLSADMCAICAIVVACECSDAETTALSVGTSSAARRPSPTRGYLSE